MAARSLVLKPFFLAATLVALSGCAGGGLLGGGGLGDIFGGGSQNQEVVAEIRFVDTRARSIELRTQDGRTGTVRYDDRTRVIYQQQEYPASALETGDVVRVRLVDDRGESYAETIYVEQNVRDRGGYGGGQANVTRFEGRVGYVDSERGTFELRAQQGTVTVTLPYNARREDIDQLRRLRSGDFVRIEGSLLSGSRVELVRFM